MSKKSTKGLVYRCPVCGAEIVVLAFRTGVFMPHCCNRLMEPTGSRAAFYVCPVCGAEAAVVLSVGADEFSPRCCNVPMQIAA